MANFFDQFDAPATTGSSAGALPLPSGQAGANFFDQFDDAPDITAPGGLGYAEQQFAQQPAAPEADVTRMNDLANAYRQAPAGRGQAVDSRAQAMAADTQNNNPYLNATMQGMTVGLADEMGAGVRTGLGQGDYDENLAVEREVLRRQRQERPWGMMGAEIVGAAIPAVLTGGVSVAARALPQAPAWLARTADAAINGGLWGGAYGAGTGEGVEGRLYEAGKGALIGAGAGGVLQPVIEGAGAAGRAAVNAVGDYIAPFSQGGRERMAGATIRDAATDPAAVRGALENPSQDVPVIPGSQPTTFQQTGDMGLGALERRAETQNAVPFQQRRAEQNQARVDALQGIQQVGSPDAVVGALRRNLARLDQDTEAALQRVTRAAQEKSSRLGGQRAPEDYGSSIRQSLSAAEDAARSRERALWEAVDPDGTLALPGDPIRSEVVSVLRTLPKAAKPMEGEERAIFSAAAAFKGVVPFREVSALRTRVSTDMRRELSRYGSTPVYARLAQLRGAIERTIEDAVAGKAAQELDAVASGAMREEDTMAALIRSWTDNWRVGRAEAEMGSSLAEGAGGYAPSGSATIRPASGADRAGRGRFEQASGGEGVSGTQPRIPNFDGAALGRLREANDATKARANTYGTKPVGDVLRRSGQEGPFSVPAAAVPARFFRPGPRGYEDVQALRRAADDPQTMKTIRDYAISTLRRFAEGQDGTLDPSKVTIWRQRHQDALRAFPEIDRLLKGPVEASETMARVAVARKAELDEFRAGAIGRLIDADPEDVTRKLGALFSTESPVKTMRRLEVETRNNPEAREGLRKGVADWIAQRFLSNTEAGTSGQTLMRSDAFQQFMRQHESTLGVIFKPGEVRALKAISADLQQANRSITAVKLPGRSNTPQDIFAAARDANVPQSWLSWALLRGAQGAAGTAVAGPWGAAAAPIAGELLGALRRSGIQKVDDIITDAMLNPGRALMLLSKAPAKPTQKDVAAFAQRYRKAVFPSVLAAIDGESEPRQ